MIWRKAAPNEQQKDRPRGFDDYELRLGDLMRGERATLGKSLLDVQRELHIRASYIAAIESGDLDAFETPSFVAGFVRSYARYLGMDPEWVYAKFCTETGFSVLHGMAAHGSAQGSTHGAATDRMPRTAPVTAEGSGALRGFGLLPDPDPFWKRVEPGALGSVTVLLALILGLGFAGWTVLQQVQQVQIAPADVVPNVVSDLNPLAPSLAASAGSDDRIETPLQGASGQVRILRAQALDVPVVVPRDGPIAAIPVEAPLRIATDAAVAMALEAASDEGAPQVILSGPAAVELLAVRPSWVRVRGADGSVIFERILEAGERYTLPQSDTPPTLHAGNAGSVYFLIDGRPYGPAAPGATVVRGVALDLDSLRERYAAADLDRDGDLRVLVAELSQD
jgi:hypothetical protein